MYEINRHVLPTAPSPTTTHLIVCIFCSVSYFSEKFIKNDFFLSFLGLIVRQGSVCVSVSEVSETENSDGA